MSPEEESDLEATMAAAGVVLAAEDEDATAVPWDDADRAELGGGDAATAAEAAEVAGDFFRMLSPPPPPL